MCVNVKSVVLATVINTSPNMASPDAVDGLASHSFISIINNLEINQSLFSALM